MPSFGFVNGSSVSESSVGDCQRTVNWYPEYLESSGYDGKQSPYPTPKAKSRMALYPSPGLIPFATLAGRPRAQKEVNGRLFVIASTILYEVFNNGTNVQRGTGLIDDDQPATMVVSQIELCICAAGQVFILNLASNVFTPINQALFQGGLVSQVEFVSSYFIALLANSQKFQISGTLNGLSWAALDIAQVQDFPDNIVTMIADHNEILFGGNTKSDAWYNNGAASFPFAVNQAAAIIEQGSAAAFARDRLDNTIFWLGADSRGNGIAWRLNGYTPQRISTHSEEFLWAKYPKISDAVSYSYQIKGHGFWQIYFPSATVNSAGEPTKGATWVYDASTGLWHERQFVDKNSGQRMAHRSWNHAFAFGKHIVGDWNDTKLYQMAIPVISGTAWQFIDDFGNATIRERVGPHIAGEGQWIAHNALSFDLEFGLGPQPPLTGGGIPTQLALKDANGVVWLFSVTDAGLLFNTSSINTAFAMLTLNDPGNTTSWVVGVNTSGQLTTTATTFSAANAQSFPFISLGGISAWNLTVTSGGIPQTTKTGDVARDPMITVSWSDDGAKTWNVNPRNIGIGQAGKFKTRAVTRMLGRSRDRVYKLTTADPVPVRILDAYLNPVGV